MIRADGPLSGIRVIDISQHMAGPAAAQKLGDMGADVIKVEPPGLGEWTRTRSVGDAWVGDLSTSFLALNRNKRGLVLNLKQASGYEVLRDLVRGADVLISNLRPDASLRLRVDYASLAVVNPRLVYCSISGWGETGPGANRPGQDLLAQAYSGVAWNAGTVDGPPVVSGTYIADATTGNLAVSGILAGLFARTRTGRGQKVEVNLLSSMLDLQIQEITTYLNTGVAPQRSREPLGHPLLTGPYGIHKTRDHWIALAMAPLDQLATILQCDELRQFPDWAAAFTHRDRIFRLVGHELCTRTTAEWLEVFRRHDIWAGPVNTYAEIAADPQVVQNEMVWEVSHPSLGAVRLVALPITFSDTRAAVRSVPPALGEHSDEILRDIGRSEDEIRTLRELGVVQ